MKIEKINKEYQLKDRQEVFIKVTVSNNQMFNNRLMFIYSRGNSLDSINIDINEPIFFEVYREVTSEEQNAIDLLKSLDYIVEKNK